MRLKMINRLVIALVSMGFVLNSQALVLDFTHKDWNSVITGNTATLGDVSLTASVGNLTFNANDKAGCVAGAGVHGLACDGDGIGINDDEITQGGIQSITVTFAGIVDIFGVDLLDLFGAEKSGETALIMEANGIASSFKAPPGNNGVAGGYWATGFNVTGISQLILFSPDDGFSDFSLARIHYQTSSVAEPGSMALLGLGLLGIGFARRRRSA